ncbi:MAG: rhodanese-like domain-containing protein [Terriglobales bacterium]
MKPRFALIVVLLTFPLLALAQSAQSIDARHVIEPADLASLLPTSKPLVFMVGPHTLYAQAHINGAEYIGMTSQPEGIKALRERVQKLPKTRLIVLYCGCCPWDRCPNMAPAFNELQKLGFNNVKALHIAQNFGADWVNKGLPTQKGDTAQSQGQ